MSMDRYFHKLEVGKQVVRYNWVITAHANLFSISGVHIHAHESVVDIQATASTKIEDCHVRCERQVLQRLPVSGALLFTIKTYLFPVVDIAREPGVAANLKGAIDGMDGDMSYYKGKPRWEHVVVPYLESVIAEM